MLHSRRHFKDYKNYIHPAQGFNQDIVNEFFKNVGNFSREEKHGILLLHEIKFQEYLVWENHTCD